MCIYGPMPHTLSYCSLIGKCALIRSNTVSICAHIFHAIIAQQENFKITDSNIFNFSKEQRGLNMGSLQNILKRMNKRSQRITAEFCEVLIIPLFFILPLNTEIYT